MNGVLGGVLNHIKDVYIDRTDTINLDKLGGLIQIVTSILNEEMMVKVLYFGQIYSCGI
jgi:hypothetical protein